LMILFLSGATISHPGGICGNLMVMTLICSPDLSSSMDAFFAASLSPGESIQ
jgi:hypothetical protein